MDTSQILCCADIPDHGLLLPAYTDRRQSGHLPACGQKRPKASVFEVICIFSKVENNNYNVQITFSKMHA